MIQLIVGISVAFVIGLVAGFCLAALISANHYDDRGHPA